MHPQRIYFSSFNIALLLAVLGALLFLHEASLARGFRIKSPEIKFETPVHPKGDFEGNWKFKEGEVPPHFAREFPRWQFELKPIEGRFKEETQPPKVERLSSSMRTEFLRPDYLERTVSSPRMISLYPVDSPSFSAVFGRPPSVAEGRALTKLGKDMKPQREISQSSANDIEGFSIEIRSTESDLITIFAHSKSNGVEVMFPSGNSYSRVEIMNVCRAYGKNCLLLTCNGADFAISGKLAASHAVLMHRAGLNALRASKETNFTAGQFRGAMINARKTRIATERISLSALTVSPSGVYLVTTEEKARKQPAPRNRNLTTRSS